LQDHIWVPVSAELVEKHTTFDVLRNPTRAAEEREIYTRTKQGLLSETALSGFAFLPLSSFADKEKIVESARSLIFEDVSSGTRKTLELQKEWLEKGDCPALEILLSSSLLQASSANADLNKSHITFIVALMHPFSRGSVHISSTDPLAKPLINPHFLENTVDIDILVDALKHSRRVMQTAPLCEMIKREVAPGHAVQTDEEIKQYIRNQFQTVYHPLGTAAMLPLEDGGVVDANLKVYGTQNLRVVDASIIPIQIAVHPQATLYAIAEKAADIIKLS
jgi:choline dehydrogenase-like flavoprotein